MLKNYPGYRALYNPLFVTELFVRKGKEWSVTEDFWWTNLVRSIFRMEKKPTEILRSGKSCAYVEMRVGGQHEYLEYQTDEDAESAYNQILKDIEEAYQQFKVPVELFSKK